MLQKRPKVGDIFDVEFFRGGAALDCGDSSPLWNGRQNTPKMFPGWSFVRKWLRFHAVGAP